MNTVELRFEAMQCHLAATRSKDLDERARLHHAGINYSALADQAETGALSPGEAEGDTSSAP